MRARLVIACSILFISSFAAASDSKGPTIFLDCAEGENVSNPLRNFMYFVPLISPTLVDNRSSEKNSQSAGIISCERKIGKDSFFICCEFYMKGSGFNKNIFDSTQMIKRNMKKVNYGRPIKNILDYIKFEGTGYGKIEARGDIVDGIAKVQDVKVSFDSRDDKSPVTIGLYSVECIDGKYRYESKYNQVVARIRVLEFERSPDDDIPKMSLKVASLGKEETQNSFWGHIKGTIANWFIPPIEINPLGNDTMLDLGLALLNGQRVFTFPKAKNLKE